MRCFSGEGQYFGIGAALENSRNGFFFEITMDGFFKIYVKEEGKEHVLSASTSSGIKRRAYNDLMIIKSGRWLYCYINFSLHGSFLYEPKGSAFVLVQHWQQYVACDYLYVKEKLDGALPIPVVVPEHDNRLDIKGNVVEAGTGNPLVARIKYQFRGSKIWHFVPTGQDGSFTITLADSVAVNVAAQKEGYFGRPVLIGKKELKHKGHIAILTLEPLAPGVTLQLNNLYFEFSKPILVKGSQPELERLKALLLAHPKMMIEIGGHTSMNNSPEVYNKELSLQRANAVKEYLLEEGIDPVRITTKGYGNSKPIESRTGEAYQEKNRRVEFTVVRM
jgi:outer membrane protein OmpA-like peptidoglycan-associated protein